MPEAPVARQHHLPHAHCHGDSSRRAGHHGSSSHSSRWSPTRGTWNHLTSPQPGPQAILPSVLWPQAPRPGSTPSTVRHSFRTTDLWQEVFNQSTERAFGEGNLGNLFTSVHAVCRWEQFSPELPEGHQEHT